MATSNSEFVFKSTERLEDLGYCGLKFIQDKSLYTFTSDAVLLANFVSAKKSDVLADFGTGSGIIAVLVSAKETPRKIYAVEIQEEMADLAKKNVAINNLDQKIEVLHQSIQDFAKRKAGEPVDVIVCNPPYKKAGTSLYNENIIKSIARHEIEMDMDILCKSVSKSLKSGGKFFVCYDANRCAELMSKLKTQKLEPKRVFFSHSTMDAKATLVFVEAIKDGKESVEILPPLITNDKDGGYVQSFRTKYRKTNRV